MNYEKLCREAGCSEDTTKAILRYLDAEKKRLKRAKDTRERKGIVFNRMSAFEDEDGITFSSPLLEADAEDEFFHNEVIREIRELMAGLDEDDRNFLLALYGDDAKSETQLASELNITRKALRYRKSRLLKHFRDSLTAGE